MSSGERSELSSGRGDVIRAVILPQLGDDQPRFVEPWLMWRFLATHWLLLVACAIVGGLAGYAGSYAFTKVYRAEVLVAPVQDESATGLGSLAGAYGLLAGASALGLDLRGSNNSSAQAIAQIQSRQFIERFIEDESLLPVLFPRQASEGDRPTLQDAYNRFVHQILLVREDRVTKLITIRIDWRDRIVAAEWANKLVDRINAVTRADAIQETDRTLEYLRNALDQSDYVKLRASISSVIEAQFNKRMLAQTRPDYAFRVIDPAKPSDANKHSSPRRILFAAFGVALGSVVGLWVALLRRRHTPLERGRALHSD